MDGYPSPIAAKLTGVSVQTLQTWSHRGFLKPSVPGRAPRPGVYTFRDLVAIRVADDLRARGIEIHCLKRIVAYLRKRKGLALTASDVLASTLLVTDGHDVYEIDGDVGISTLRNPDQSVMLVPFGRVVAKLREDALRLSSAA